MQKMNCLFLQRSRANWLWSWTFLLWAWGASAATNPACPTCVLDYPYSSSNPRTSVIFNENEILRAFSTNSTGRGDTIRVWYNDEHALALGIRQVIVKTVAGSVTNNYPISPLTNSPSAALRPMVGTTAMTGDQAGTDLSDRPMFPALFLTDITTNLANKAGDWQFGGTPILPHAVFGSWKGCVRMIDKTRSPAVITVTADADPAKNQWNLAGGDAPPTGTVNQGYGAEVRWNVDELGLVHGHVYRLYFMVHDGDQNKNGGDSGHACLNVIVLDRPPVANDDAYTIDERTSLAVPAPGVLANDSDIDDDPMTALLVSSPAHGAVNFNADGSFQYVPARNFAGTDTFTYLATDGTSNSVPATVTITVRPVNEAPVAVNDTYTVDEDMSLVVVAPGVLVNDTDADGDNLSAILIASPAHGNLTLNADGSLRYTPVPNYNGPDSFTYKANDGALDSAPAMVTINVRPVNDAPVALSDSYSIDEDTPLIIGAPGVLANDSDADGDRLSSILVTAPAHGTVTLNPDGSFRYTGAANYNGTDLFTYKANDGALDSAPATVTITIRPINDAPVAVNDSYSVNEDTPLVIAAPGVLANDTDADGDRLSAILVTAPAHGTLSFNPDGSFRYTGAANYNGTDTFTYKANDGALDSVPATVTITIRPINDAPVAVNDFYSVNEDTPLVIAAPGVLANDTDADGDRLSSILVTAPAHGTLTLNPDGSFRYTGAANYNGTDTFTYKANDGAADSGSATVTIAIRPVNDAPVAVNDAYSIDEDTPLVIAAPGVLANDTDADGDRLSAILVTAPAHGTLTLNTDGSFRYTGAANYHGTDTFTYKANDGALDSTPATVTIMIRTINDAPVAVNDFYSVNEDTPLIIVAPGVLANDTDADGDRLSAILVTAPVHGTLTLNQDGSFRYTGAANYNGADTFAYKANDGTLDSAPATVTITIRPVNDAPVAVNDFYTVDEDTPLVIAAPGVLANDTDADGDRLSAILVTGPSHGTLALNPDGSFRYLGAADYNGTDTFSYKANDGLLDSAPATVIITIRPVDDAPSAADDVYIAFEDTTLSISAPGVLANDSDIDRDTLSAVLVSGPAHGTLTLGADGHFIYNPNPEFNGPDYFFYLAHGGPQDSDPAAVRIDVRPVNDAPSFRKGPSQLINPDAGPQTILNWATAISAGPPDEANQTLTFIVVNDTNALFSAQPAISPNGTLTYTAAPHAYGIAHVTVILKDNGGTANDGVDTSAPQSFTITVNAPPLVSIVQPTNNAVFIAPANICLIAEAHDPDGTVSDVRIFQGENLLARTNTSPALTMWTNVPAGTYQFMAQATDNLGATATSSTVNVTVLAGLPLFIIQAPRFNPQTGLFEEVVRIVNPTPAALTAGRVMIRNLLAGAQVFNASGTINGVSFVQTQLPILAGTSIDLTIEYYVPAFQTPNPSLTAESAGPMVQTTSAGFTLVPTTREMPMHDGTFLLEYNSTANRIYFVQYSADMKGWKTAWPSVKGSGNRIQWIDNGLPRTDSIPSTELCRFYRVVLAP